MYSDYILFPGIREKTNNFFNSFFLKKKIQDGHTFLLDGFQIQILGTFVCVRHTHIS